jgi:hypothetical protein
MSSPRQDRRTRRAFTVIAAITTAFLAGGCTGGPATAGNASPAPGRPTVTGPSASRNFTTFAGDWGGHERGLSIRADGYFTLMARTYRVCGQDPPPCDIGTEPGDRASGWLTSVSGDVATGKVTHTTDQTGTPLGRITFTLNPETDIITAEGATWCGNQTPVGTCG